MSLTLDTFQLNPTTTLSGTNLELRIWYANGTSSFLDVNGNTVQTGNGSTGFYIALPCSIASSVITVTSGAIFTTLDAQIATPQSIQTFARLFSNNAPKDWVFAGWVIPNQSAFPGGVITFEQLTIWNAGNQIQNPPTTYWTQQQTASYFNTLSPAPDASALVKGITKLSVAPASATNPIARGANDFSFAAGVPQFGPGTNYNEPAQYSAGSTAFIWQGAQGTHSVPVTTSQTVPGVVLQRFGKNSSGILFQTGYYQLAVDNLADYDIYNVYPYTEFSANLTANSGHRYNIHGIRSEVVLNATNVGNNIIQGFNWFRTQKYCSNSFGFGLQVEGNNLTGVDDNVDPIQGQPGDAALIVAGGGNAHSSSGIHFQAGSGASSSYFNGITVEPTALGNYVIDAHRAYTTLQGTITFTGGSPTITGVGTKFIKELHMGDQVIVLGSAFTIASDPVSDTSATLTVNFGGSTAPFTSVQKTATFARMACNAYITSTTALALSDPTSQTQYRLLGLNNSNVVSIDPDARGVVFGSTITATTVTGSTSLVVANTGKLTLAPETADAWGAGLVINSAISNHVIAASFTTSATCTITPTGAGSAGDIITITTKADASGSVTVTFGSTFHPSGTQVTTASHFSTIVFQSDSVRWLEISRTTNLA